MVLRETQRALSLEAQEEQVVSESGEVSRALRSAPRVMCLMTRERQSCCGVLSEGGLGNIHFLKELSLYNREWIICSKIIGVRKRE